GADPRGAEPCLVRRRRARRARASTARCGAGGRRPARPPRRRLGRARGPPDRARAFRIAGAPRRARAIGSRSRGELVRSSRGGGAGAALVVPGKTARVLRARGGRIGERARAGIAPGASSGEDARWEGGAGLSSFWWLPLGRIEAGLEAGTLGQRTVSVRLGTDF